MAIWKITCWLVHTVNYVLKREKDSFFTPILLSSFLPSPLLLLFILLFLSSFLPSFYLSFSHPLVHFSNATWARAGPRTPSVSESWVAAPQYISLVFHTAFQGRISGGILRTTLTKHLLWKEQFLTEDKYIKGELQEVFEPFSGENKVLKQKVESCCVQICRH